MDIQDLKPRWGQDIYRIGDSDDLVVMENGGPMPSGAVCLQEHLGMTPLEYRMKYHKGT